MRTKHVIFVLCFLHVNAQYKTGQFDIKGGEKITENPNTTENLQTRSEIECVNKCFQMKDDECCACSYNPLNKTCIVHKSAGKSVKTELSEDFSTAHRKHNALQIRDCCDLSKGSRSGVYTIYPIPSVTFDVYCDMETDGGGWTVFQRRMDGSTDFYRNWREYEMGFGDLIKDFWLGNRQIHLLTSNGSYKLRVDIEDGDMRDIYAQYSEFSIGDSESNYIINVGGYKGTAGDALSVDNNTMFSTYDRRNEECYGLCGGWWGHCDWANLNYFGDYLGHWNGDVESSSMMIKRKNCQ